jgi:hypothetical protein
MTKSNKLTQTAGGHLRRFSAVEHEAERIASEQNGRAFVRAVLSDGKLHAIIQDECGAVLELAEGKIPLTVRNEESGG